MFKGIHKQKGSNTAIFLVVILTLSISSFIMMPTKALAASPTITLLPPAGPPGTPITVNGANFQPGATVDLTWYGYIVDVPGITGHLGYYPIETGITVASDGNFSTTIITPYDIGDVAHFVNATQNGDGTGIINGTFTIMPFMQLSPTPANYTEGQEVILHVYGAPTGTIPVPPTMELESLKFTYDNTQWGYDDSHLTTEGPIATGGFTGGDIGGNITIRFTAVGGVGEHDIRCYEGPSTTAAWLSCEIGSEVTFYIVGPSSDTQTILNDLSNIDAKIVSIQGDVATITTNTGTISGNVTSISNGMATVNTSLGTLTLSVDGVNSSTDSTVNYGLGALILSVIDLVILLAVAILVLRKH
jgi:hypothetical protein